MLSNVVQFSAYIFRYDIDPAILSIDKHVSI